MAGRLFAFDSLGLGLFAVDCRVDRVAVLGAGCRMHIRRYRRFHLLNVAAVSALHFCRSGSVVLRPVELHELVVVARCLQDLCLLIGIGFTAEGYCRGIDALTGLCTGCCGLNRSDCCLDRHCIVILLAGERCRC